MSVANDIREMANRLASINNPDQTTEAVSDWTQPTRHEFNDDMTGDNYLLEFQDRNGDEIGFVEVNGVAAGMFTVGGGGAMNTKIQNPDEIMNMLVALMADK